MAGRRQGSRRSGGPRRGGDARRYPRAARVNEVLRQVLAEEFERLFAGDDRLTLLTVTAVEVEPDFRHATVLLAHLDPPLAAALAEIRPRLQAAVARQVRLKWTPTLSFTADPAIAEGERVEEILRDLADQRPANPQPEIEVEPGDGDREG
ncbi:MAG TPA: ribosome-binding factor A [Acidimicrobiales bacterium]|nr:ribosome-binding factor A [Acidimicrobiales bacterium]